MNLSYLDVLNRASQKAKEARAIIDKATAGGLRELTSAEMARVKSLGEESDLLREQGEAMQAAEAREKYFRTPVNEPIRPDLGGGGPVTCSYQPGEIRTLRHGERLSTDNATDRLNIGKLIRGMAVGKWDHAEAEQRVMSTLGASSGGILVPEILSLEIIDLFRAESVLSQAGMITIPMTSTDLTIPVVETDPVASWTPENADFTDSEPSLNWCKLTARKLGIISKASIELVEDSPLAATVLANLLATAIAQEVDSAALFGTGVAEPMGVMNDLRVEKINMGTNGAAITDYSKILQAVQILMQNNVPAGPGEISVIMSPREWATLAGFKESAGPYLPPPAWLSERVTFRVASKLPIDMDHGTASNASQILVGRVSEMALGVRTEINLEASRVASDSTGSAFRKGQIWTRAYLRADIAIKRPSAFTIIDGVVPA